MPGSPPELQSQTSTEDQVKECRRFIAAKGCTVAEGSIYIDEARREIDDEQKEGVPSMTTVSRNPFVTLLLALALPPLAYAQGPQFDGFQPGRVNGEVTHHPQMDRALQTPIANNRGSRGPRQPHC
jgi:hypothetical protein